MSDLLEGFFDPQPKSVNQKKYKNKKYLDDPYMLVKGDPTLTILSDIVYTEKQLYGVQKTLESIGITDNYQILSVLRFKPSDKDLEKEVVKLYKRNSFDLTKYIPKGTNVISVGRSLYSVIQSDDLYIDGFKDTMLWRTSFFSPDLNCMIYPVSSFSEWFKKDNFDHYFFEQQCGLARTTPVKKKRIPKLNKTLVDNPNKWLLDRINDRVPMAWDTETKGLNPWDDEGKIICLTVAFDSKTGYYLPWDKIDVNVLSQFFKTKKHIGTNLKYDMRWVVSRGVEFNSMTDFLWDTMHASHTINEMQRNGLKSDTWLYTPYGGYDRELDDYVELHPECKKDYSKIPFDLLFEYATQDPIMSFSTYEEQNKIIDELDSKFPLENGWSIRRYLEEIRMPSIPMYADIELKGMMINFDKLKESSKILRNQVWEAEKNVLEAFDLTRDAINIHSTEKLGELIRSLGWRIDEWSKKGTPKVGAPQLKRWVKQGHNEAQLILDMVEKTTMFNNFIGDEQGIPIVDKKNKNKKEDNSFNLFEDIDIDTSQEEVEGNGNGYFQYIGNDGLIHGSFLNMMANSHRNRSRNPNLQNQPSHGDKAFFIRQNICCPKWGKFLSADYSGLQLRIACILSGDKAMKKVFTEMGGDMHSMTAQSVVMNSSITLEEFLKKKKDGDEEISKLRFKAKACFVEGTKVLTSEGVKRIEDIVPEVNEGDFVKYKGEIKLWNRTSLEKPNYSIYKEVGETIIFELENGDSIEVTPDHLMVIIRNQKEIKIPASQVLDSDEVVFYDGEESRVKKDLSNKS